MQAMQVDQLGGALQKPIAELRMMLPANGFVNGPIVLLGLCKVSNDPLTTEQIAVYRAVLGGFLKGSDGALNLANIRTVRPVQQSMFQRGGCGSHQGVWVSRPQI